MSSPFDGYWLFTALGVSSLSLHVAVAATGFVLALRRWHTGGRTARLAAAGFGLSLLDYAPTVVGYLRPELWTFYTPYGGGDPAELWPQLAWSAVLTLANVASAALLLAALYSAWRRWERADVTDPARR